MTSILSSSWLTFVQAVIALAGTWLLAFGLKSLKETRGFDTSDPQPLSWRFWGGLILLSAAALPPLISPFFLPDRSEGKARDGKRAALHQYMTMLDVEQLLGTPDRVEIKEGKIEGTLEHPKVISWIYSKFRVTDSGPDFGQPGHVTFIPLRFTERGWNDAEADKTAREYGEQTDAFCTYGFRGSFPVDRKDWEPAGLFDGVPLKPTKK
jgi:hypothetical protein